MRKPPLALPAFIAPCLPVLTRSAPAGPDWSHEIKHDGYRVICAVAGSEARIHTRRGHDWTQRMPAIAAGVAELGLRQAVVDGEAVMFDAAGVSDFHTLHASLAARHAPGAVLLAFDLLMLDGQDLRAMGLEARREALQALLRGRNLPALQFSEEIGGEGAAAFRAAEGLGLEGIVSKRRGSAYVSGKSPSWRKTKCTLTEAFAVVGADPRRGAVRSLRLAHLVDGTLTRCGSAGSGLTEADGLALRDALEAGRPVVATIEFRGFTPAGELRHPVVRGFVAD